MRITAGRRARRQRNRHDERRHGQASEPTEPSTHHAPPQRRRSPLRAAHLSTTEFMTGLRAGRGWPSYRAGCPRLGSSSG
jgi:hypothetical protein